MLKARHFILLAAMLSPLTAACGDTDSNGSGWDIGDHSSADVGNFDGGADVITAEQPLACRHEYYDSDDDDLTWIDEFTYDEDGRRTARRGESRRPGHVGLIELYTYDSEGWLRTVHTDIDGDEQFEERTTWRTEPKPGGGYLRTGEVDQGLDGTLDELLFAEHDEARKRHRLLVDKDADDTWDERQEYIYEDGLLVEYKQDLHDNGVIDNQTFYRYSDSDSGGRQTKVEIDLGADGNPDLIFEYIYEEGRLVRWEKDGDADGHHDQYVTVIYDC